MSVSVPGRTGSTVMGRKTTCNGCGYSQYTVLSYYLDRKLWEQNHNRELCRKQKKLS